MTSISRYIDYPVLVKSLDYYYADLLGKDWLFVYEDLGIVSLGFPGYCGCLTATNHSGLTVSAHTSVCQDPARGMPTGLLYRTIMQYTSTLQQAKDCLTHLPKTVGNNLMISSAQQGGACIAEIHPQQVTFRDQEEIADVRWTTNHYRMSETLPYQKKASIGSLTRHRSIIQSLQAHHPETIEDLKSIMSCYDGNVEGRTSVANCGTIQSVIVDAKAGVMHVARHDTAPVTQGGYQEVKLEWK